MSETDHNNDGSNAVAEHKKGDVDSPWSKLTRGRSRMDLLINGFGLLALISGGVLAVVGIFTHWKHKESIAIWSFYFTIVFAVTAFFFFWQKTISERAKAQGAETTPTTPQPLAERPELFIEHSSIDPLVAGENPKAKITIKNIGKANAYRIEMKTAVSTIYANNPGPLMDYLAPNFAMPNLQQHDLLPAGERINLLQVGTPYSEADINQINSRSRLLFLTGHGHYEDADGTSYPLAYCFLYEQTEPFRLVHCPVKYWPREPDGKLKIAPERRAWMITESTGAKDFSPGSTLSIATFMLNVGELPAIIKSQKVSAKIARERIAYSEPMTLKDIDDTDVEKPLGPFPVSTIGPGQRIGLPVQSVVSAEEFREIMEGSLFMYVFAGIEYETRGVVHYTVSCSVYEPTLKHFVVCGGGMD
jgi:hypothetical protein